MAEKFTFTVKSGEEEKAYAIVAPSLEITQEGQRVYNTAFASAIASKAMLRAKVDDFAREQGLWDDAKLEQVKELRKKVSDQELQILEGGIKLSEAKKVAINIRRDRNRLRILLGATNTLDSHTAESQAESARFNYLVSACTVYNDTDKPVWANTEEFLNSKDVALSEAAQSKYAALMWGVDENYDANLPENTFLKEFGFINDALQLVNEDNHLVDEDGNLIDEFGNLVDADGNFINESGCRIDEKGRPIVERKPFLNEDGEPIVSETDKVTDEETEATSDPEVDA